MKILPAECIFSHAFHHPNAALHRELNLPYNPDACLTCGETEDRHHWTTTFNKPEEPEGTFACPICGLDSPHEHTSAEIVAFRAEPQAGVQVASRDERVHAPEIPVIAELTIDGQQYVTMEQAENLRDALRVLREERDRLKAAIEEFELKRGLHDGDHVFCCTNNGRCLRCDESYVVAEAALHEALQPTSPVPSSDIPHALSRSSKLH